MAGTKRKADTKRKPRLRRRTLLRKMSEADATTIARRFIAKRGTIPHDATLTARNYLLPFKAWVFESAYREAGAKKATSLVTFWVKNDNTVFVIDAAGIEKREDKASTRSPQRAPEFSGL